MVSSNCIKFSSFDIYVCYFRGGANHNTLGGEQRLLSRRRISRWRGGLSRHIHHKLGISSSSRWQSSHSFRLDGPGGGRWAVGGWVGVFVGRCRKGWGGVGGLFQDLLTERGMWVSRVTFCIIYHCVAPPGQLHPNSRDRYRIPMSLNHIRDLWVHFKSYPKDLVLVRRYRRVGGALEGLWNCRRAVLSVGRRDCGGVLVDQF